MKIGERIVRTHKQGENPWGDFWLSIQPGTSFKITNRRIFANGESYYVVELTRRTEKIEGWIAGKYIGWKRYYRKKILPF